MWIFFLVFKSLAMVFAVLLGLASKKNYKTSTEIHREQTVHISLRTHKGTITGRSVGIDYRGPKFRLVRESPWDRRFKDWGLSSEVQTGDKAFDDAVYVISDNPLLATHLSFSQESRDAVRSLLQSNYQEIVSDGEHLWLSANGSQQPDSKDKDHILDLGEKMKGLQVRQTSLLADPFYAKAVTAEVLLYALSGYALVSVVELASARETLILDSTRGYLFGLGLAVLLFVAMLGSIRFFFKGSSRGHRVILESTLLLILSLPPTGIQLFSDLNVGLDGSAPFVVTARVEGMRTVYHKTKSSGYHTYHLSLSPSHEGPVNLPPEISVPAQVYVAQSHTDLLDLRLKKGALGLPWIEGMDWKQATDPPQTPGT